MTKTHTPRLKRGLARLAPLILAGSLACYFLSFYDVDLNLTDEGLYLAHAHSIESGEVNGATIDRLLQRRLGILHHTLFQLAGYSDVAVSRLLWVLLRVLIGLMTLAVARRLMPLPLAALAATLVAIAAGPLHKTWYPFALGAVLLLASRAPVGRQRRTLYLGLAGGALFILFPVGIGIGVVLPIFGFLVVEEARSRTILAAFKAALRLAGAAIGGALLLSTFNAVVVVLTRGADPRLIWHGPLSILYLASPDQLSHWLRFATRWSVEGHLSLSSLFQGGEGVLFWVPGLFFLLQPGLIVAAVWLVAKGRGDRDKLSAEETRLLSLLLVLAAANFVKTMARPDLFHVTQSGGPAYLLAIWSIWSGASAIRSSWRLMRPLPRTCYAVCLALAFTLFPTGYAAAVLLSPAQWAASPGSLVLAERRAALDRARLRMPRSTASQLEEVVKRIESWTGPEDPIFTMPACPGLYFLSDRLCVADDGFFPLGQMGVLPGRGLIRDRGEEDEHLAELLETRQVKVVVVCSPASDPLFRPSWSTLPRTRALLRRRYQIAFEGAEMKILRRSSE
jgi:hypothetical protein